MYSVCPYCEEHTLEDLGEGEYFCWSNQCKETSNNNLSHADLERANNPNVFGDVFEGVACSGVLSNEEQERIRRIYFEN
jgi:hypothetical protein